MNTSATPVVTLSLFRFESVRDKFWAFTGMRLSHPAFSHVAGLLFYKLMGSGSKGGFHWYPEFGVYGFLGVWTDRRRAEDFFVNNSKIVEYQAKAIDSIRFYLKPISAHGAWSGIVPFEASTGDHEGPVAILTRARIRLNRLAEFWSNVGRTAAAIEHARGCSLSVGIGEWPLIEQATFSVWSDLEAVRNYAYKGKEHSKVVQKTRKRNWYSEEFFARMALLDISGHWPGFSSEPMYLPV